MRESGYYPSGTEHLHYAPWNQVTPECETCSECKGEGKIYICPCGCLVDELGGYCKEHDEYNDSIADECEACNGEGEILIEK